MKNFITKNGLEKLEKELNDLKNEKRKEIAKRIKDAKEMGDLSENAEYAEAKEAQIMNEQKIAELEIAIKETTLVDETKNSGSTVRIGSEITAENNGKSKRFIIVGSNEADPINGKVSNASPLGAAFLNRKPGDEVEVKAPAGIVKYKIVSIE